MNSLINIIILWLVIYLSFDHFLLEDNSTLKQKILFGGIICSTQILYRLLFHLAKLNKNNELNLIDLFIEGLNRSIFVIIGLVILEELHTHPLITSNIKGLNFLIDINWFKSIILILPYLIISITFSLLKPH